MTTKKLHQRSPNHLCICHRCRDFINDNNFTGRSDAIINTLNEPKPVIRALNFSQKSFQTTFMRDANIELSRLSRDSMMKQRLIDEMKKKLKILSSANEDLNRKIQSRQPEYVDCLPENSRNTLATQTDNMETSQIRTSTMETQTENKNTQSKEPECDPISEYENCKINKKGDNTLTIQTDETNHAG